MKFDLEKLHCPLNRAVYNQLEKLNNFDMPLSYLHDIGIKVRSPEARKFRGELLETTRAAIALANFLAAIYRDMDSWPDAPRVKLNDEGAIVRDTKCGKWSLSDELTQFCINEEAQRGAWLAARRKDAD